MLSQSLHLLWVAAVARATADPSAAMNVQLYPCNRSEPWGPRQQWVRSSVTQSTDSSRHEPAPSDTFTLALASRGDGGALVLQDPAPSTAMTCSGTTCLNVIIGTPSSPTTSAAIRFQLNGSALVVVPAFVAATRAMHAAAGPLCLMADWAHGYLPNVFISECSTAASLHWSLNSDGTIGCSDGSAGAKNRRGRAVLGLPNGGPVAPTTQCLDVGSGGSAGDLGIRFGLQPVAPPSKQPYNVPSNASWGGSPIQDDSGQWHLFMAVFANGAGLKSWTSTSEVLHAVADSADSTFSVKDKVVGPFAHNPEVMRANDGTYLLFSIGTAPLLTSRSLNGPWTHTPFYSGCNNPTPVGIPGRDDLYVVCHGGPNPQHWGASVGLIYAPSWRGPWTVMSNNTEDLLDGGRNLFAHPVEDPFVWRSQDGRFHMLSHGFRMGMVNRTVGSGNGYGAYATAPSIFGPWRFQETSVLYTSTVPVQGGGFLELSRRERPKLVLNSQGWPERIFNGVCPIGSHESGRGDSGGHCYTMMQPVVCTPPPL